MRPARRDSDPEPQERAPRSVGRLVGGRFAKLAVDRFVNGSDPVLALDLFRRRKGYRRPGALLGATRFSSEFIVVSQVYKKPQTFQTLTAVRISDPVLLAVGRTRR